MFGARGAQLRSAENARERFVKRQRGRLVGSWVGAGARLVCGVYVCVCVCACLCAGWLGGELVIMRLGSV